MTHIYYLGIFTLCTLLEILAISFLLYIDINIIWLPFAAYKKRKHPDIYKYSTYVLLLNLKVCWDVDKEFNVAVEWKRVFL